MSKNLLVFPFPYCYINASTNLPNAIVLNLINSKNDLSVFNKLIKDTIAENVYDYIIVIAVSKVMTDLIEEGYPMIKLMPAPKDLHNNLDSRYKDDSIADDLAAIKELYRDHTNESIPMELSNDELLDDVLNGFELVLSKDKKYILSKNKRHFSIALDKDLSIKISGCYINGDIYFGHVLTNILSKQSYQAFHGLSNLKHWSDLKKFIESEEVIEFLK